jgi:acyl carrier protein
VTSDQVQETIAAAIRKVSPASTGVGADTPLIGPTASLDSVGFVTLLVTLEADLNNRVDLSEAFLLDGGAGPDSPFRTVGTLAAHIRQKLAAAS